jgi:hypothetical protein
MIMWSEWWKRLSKWLDNKPYTKAMYISACGALITAIMSVIMGITVLQNRESLQLTVRALSQTDESLRLTRESVQTGKDSLKVASDSLTMQQNSLKLASDALDLQKNEYQLRNRPLIICTGPRFGGTSTDSEGKDYPRSISLDLRNLTEVPATHVSATSEMYFDGKKTQGTNFNLGVLVGDRQVITDMLLTEAMYTAAVREDHSFYVIIKFTYSGMLGERVDQYLTTIRASYRPKENRFEYSYLDIR